MKPVWYNYEAEEYDLDNACNEDDDLIFEIYFFNQPFIVATNVKK